MDEGNTPSNCPSCLKDTSKDEKENFLPVGPSVQVKGSDGNSRPSNSNTAGVQYVNHLHQNADRSDGFNATVDDKGNSGKPFVRISVPVKDGNIVVTVHCVNGIVTDMGYKFKHLSDEYPKHKAKFTVKNAPGVDDIMQNHSELFFDTVKEMEQTHDSTLTEVRKGCLVLEFEHKDEGSARAMVADKDKIEKIFKVFAAKCGKEPDDISVEAEYKMYEKPESQVFEPTSLPVEDTLASGVTDIPSVSGVLQAHGPLSSTRSGDSYISDFGAPEVNRPFSFTRSHSLSSLVIDTLLPPYFWSTDFTSCQYLNETDTDLIKTKTEVTKNIGAVRNSGGGTFILNIKSHQMDAWKEHDNTFWEPCLKACLLDDEFQSDVFSITEDLQNNKVVVAIEPSSEPITCKYNTKVRSQTSLLDPTRRQMHSLMQGKRRLPESSAELRGIKRNLKEGCNIAIERVKYSEPLKDISCFVKSLFEDLRLSEYISAFSKERDGGSYFLGIEFDGKDERGKSSKYVIKGVPLEAGQQNNIICLLQEYMTGNIIVLDGEMQWSHPPPDLIKVALHPAVERNRYVIEVAVRPFNGVVFCDKMGPESYSCIYGHLQRFSKEDWLIRNRYAIF